MALTAADRIVCAVRGRCRSPLADAFRLLADAGRVDSISVAATRALEDALQAVVVGMQLDATYEEHPDARPTDEEVEAMAARAGLRLP